MTPAEKARQEAGEYEDAARIARSIDAEEVADRMEACAHVLRLHAEWCDEQDDQTRDAYAMFGAEPPSTAHGPTLYVAGMRAAIEPIASALGVDAADDPAITVSRCVAEVDARKEPATALQPLDGGKVWSALRTALAESINEDGTLRALIGAVAQDVMQAELDAVASHLADAVTEQFGQPAGWAPDREAVAKVAYEQRHCEEWEHAWALDRAVWIDVADALAAHLREKHGGQS